MNFNRTDKHLSQARTAPAATVPTLRRLRAVGISLALACLGWAGSTTMSLAQQAPARMPAVIKIVSVHELTGAAGFAGVSTRKGIDLAVAEINASNFLGAGVRLEVDHQDTASVTQNAVSLVSQAVAKPDVIAILGPLNSDAGAPVAPIAQRAKVPMVFSQALGDGILVGDYMFRSTAPLDSYYQLAIDHLKAKGVKSISVLYNSTSIRQAQGAKDMLPPLAQKAGMKILSNTGVPITSTDFTAIASKIATEKPDAVIFFMAGAQQVTSVQQVRRAGFSGILLGGSSVESALARLGETGDGIIWITNFSYLWANPSAAAFTKAYQAKFAGENPLGYAAEGYDSVWWIARGLKTAGAATRDALQRGLSQVAKSGFDGAQGKVTFVGHDAVSKGVLMQYTGGKTVLLRRGDQ